MLSYCLSHVDVSAIVGLVVLVVSVVFGVLSGVGVLLVRVVIVVLGVMVLSFVLLPFVLLALFSCWGWYRCPHCSKCFPC